MRKRTLVIFAAVLMLAAAACGSGTGAASSPPATKSASLRPSSTGKLSILQPANGHVVHGTSTPVHVRLTGASIVPMTTTNLRPDQGHLHVILDDKLISMTSGTTTSLTGLTPGTHLLKVEFVASDHAPFDPRVIAAVSFKVSP